MKKFNSVVEMVTAYGEYLQVELTKPGETPASPLWCNEEAANSIIYVPASIAQLTNTGIPEKVNARYIPYFGYCEA